MSLQPDGGPVLSRSTAPARPLAGRRSPLHFGALLLAIGLVAAPLPAFAQDELPARVGRVADVGGQVFLSPEDRTSDWTPIGINYTVTSGDNLWAGGDARAEIDFGAGRFRLAADTNVHVARLDDTSIALFVAQGRLILRLNVLEPGEVARIDTPNTQVVVTRPGLYRVEVAPQRQTTTLVVREGEANLQLANAVQQVLPGQTAHASGSDPSYADVRSGIGTDGFDVYSANRDRRYDRSRSASYVSRQMVGAVDLDDYGTWQTEPQYGAVWYPTDVPAGWAPYSSGSWSWVGGWGWTWVDAAPWGYAPFHYGRWAYIGGRWGWCPGGLVARPYWAPAMVGWVGGGGWAMSVSVGTPVYGWVPLGWGEPLVPWWRGCGTRCWTHYNRPYAVNVAERPHAPPTRYINWTVPGGVTAVAGANLVAHKPVSTYRVATPVRNLAEAPVIAGPTLVKPGAGHVPTIRAGAGGTPQPAASFYPATKPRLTTPTARPEGVAAPPATSAGPGPAAKPAVAVPGATLTPRPTPQGVNPPTSAGPAGVSGHRVPTTVKPAGDPAPAVAAPPSALGQKPAVAAPPSPGYANPSEVAPRQPGIPTVATQPAPAAQRAAPPAQGNSGPAPQAQSSQRMAQPGMPQPAGKPQAVARPQPALSAGPAPAQRPQAPVAVPAQPGASPAPAAGPPPATKPAAGPQGSKPQKGPPDRDK